MDIRDFYVLGFAFLLLIIVVLVLSRQKYPFFKFLLSCGIGIGTLFAASYLLAFTGVVLKVNLFTLVFSAVLGLPGVLLLGFLTLF